MTLHAVSAKLGIVLFRFNFSRRKDSIFFVLPMNFLLFNFVEK